MSLTLHFLRHLPPHETLAGFMYGDGEILLDETSEGVITRLNELAQILPEDARWVSSPVHRAQKTADHILSRQNRNIQPTISEHFAEQKFGRLVDQAHADLQNNIDFMTYKKDPVNVRPENGESFMDCFSRVMVGMSLLARDNKEGHIVIAAHGGVLRAAAAFVLHMDLNIVLKSMIVSPLAYLVVSHNEERKQWQFHGLTQGAAKS